MSSASPLRRAATATSLTAIAMVAFAANSLLCRVALRAEEDGLPAYEFTAVRLLSGALMLWLLLGRRRRTGDSPPAGNGSDTSNGTWLSGFWLFLYAIAFSYAYLELDAGTGAILAFGVVQATMILAGILQGERPGPAEWLGFALAAGGVAYLVLPGVTAPPLLPALCMATAGLAWALYSLRGRGTRDPGRATCGNFLRTVPMILVLAPFLGTGELTTRGLWLAVASGAISSGLGYIVWYAALGYLTATRAALVQCTAPILAALGGVWFLSETISTRLMLAGALVLGGVALATLRQRRPAG